MKNKKMLLILFLLVTITTYVLASAPSDTKEPSFIVPIIYTWGYSETMYQVLLAVQGLVRHSGYFAKSAMVIGFFLFAIRKALNPGIHPIIEFGKLILLFVCIDYFFLKIPSDKQHTFALVDERIGLATRHTVKLPIAIGQTYAWLSYIEYRIRIAMQRTYFSTPGSKDYSRAGLGYSLATATNVSRMRIVDSNFIKTFNEYVHNCVLYSVSNNELGIEQIIANDRLKDSIFNTVSTRLTMFYPPNNQQSATAGINPKRWGTRSSSTDSVAFGTFNGSKIEECKTVGAWLKLHIKGKMVNAERMTALLNNETLEQFRTHAKGIPKLFFDGKDSSGHDINADDYFEQMMLINMTSDAVINSAKTAGLNPITLSYGSAIGNQQMTSQSQVQGLLARKYLPIAKAYTEFIIVALSWLIAMLSIMYGNYKHIGMFFTLMLWMVMWTPILQVINYLNDLNLRDTFLNLKRITGTGFTIEHNKVILDRVLENSNFMNFMVMVTPMLAYSIVKASEEGFVHVAEAISGSLENASQVGGEKLVDRAQENRESLAKGDEDNHLLPDDIYGDVGRPQLVDAEQSDVAGRTWSDITHNEGRNDTQTYTGVSTDGSSFFTTQGDDITSANSKASHLSMEKLINDRNILASQLKNGNSMNEALKGEGVFDFNNPYLAPGGNFDELRGKLFNIKELRDSSIRETFKNTQGDGSARFENIKQAAIDGKNIGMEEFFDPNNLEIGIKYSIPDGQSWVENSAHTYNQIKNTFAEKLSQSETNIRDYEYALKDHNDNPQAFGNDPLRIDDYEYHLESYEDYNKQAGIASGLNEKYSTTLETYIAQDPNGTLAGVGSKQEKTKIAMWEIDEKARVNEWNELSNYTPAYQPPNAAFSSSSSNVVAPAPTPHHATLTSSISSSSSVTPVLGGPGPSSGVAPVLLGGPGSSSGGTPVVVQNPVLPAINVPGHRQSQSWGSMLQTSSTRTFAAMAVSTTAGIASGYMASNFFAQTRPRDEILANLATDIYNTTGGDGGGNPSSPSGNFGSISHTSIIDYTPTPRSTIRKDDDGIYSDTEFKI